MIERRPLITTIFITTLLAWTCYPVHPALGQVSSDHRITTVAGQLPRVMLLVFEDTRNEEVLGIVETLQLRMFDVDVKFGIKWIKPSTDDLDVQVAAARSILAEEHIQLTIFWNGSKRDTLYYLMNDTDEPMQRPIRDVGSESRPEAIAIMVQTAVESILDTRKLEDSTDEPVVIAPESVPPSAQRIIAVRPPRRRSYTGGRFPDMYMQLGYEMNAVNGTPTILHGGNIRLGIQPVPRLRGFLGFGAVSRRTSQEMGFEVKQLRFPIELGLLSRFRHGDLAFSGGMSFLLVSLKNTPATQNASAELKSSYWASGLMLRFFLECSYRLHEKIELFVNVHLLMDLNKVTYQVQNGPVLFDEYNRLWPGLQAGITFLLF